MSNKNIKIKCDSFDYVTLKCHGDARLSSHIFSLLFQLKINFLKSNRLYVTTPKVKSMGKI